ncbi:DUF2073 domain-containing protein [Candidatus Woesearchaeota archaeon]|nr:DUF2073 domain-containing protein [Candidatus Woesearchaeota archaeon]
MLTLQFIPFTEIESLSSDERVGKLLSIVKENKIALVEGTLHKEESAALIKKTMKSINQDFRGIELAVLYPEQNDDAMFKRLRLKLINALLGNRRGLTIIGPASVVKEIKQDPHKIDLYTTINEQKSRKVSKRNKK